MKLYCATRDNPMLDVYYILLSLLFFVIAALMIRLCEKV